MRGEDTGWGVFCGACKKRGEEVIHQVLKLGMMVMRKWMIGALVVCGAVAFAEDEIAQACVSNYYCNDGIPRTRADNIPQTHVANMCDEYLTGYVQALVDMHYYEFEVRTIVREGVVFVFNLPNNELISNSILCFIYDIPCVQCIQRVNCCPEDFICALEQYDPAAACDIAVTDSYAALCQCPEDRCAIRGIWFPQNTVLFPPLIADPRQVTNAAALRFNDDVIGKHVGAVSFGDDFIFLRLKDVLYWHGDMDLGIEAGIFSVFDLDHVEACMVNTDFYVAALVSYAFDRWSFRFRLWHLSSHIGDEFLISNPGFDRRNLSDEGADLFVAYQLGQAIRLYLGVGDIFARDKEFPEHPFYVDWGAEIRVFGGRDCFNKLYVQPFLAMNFSSWEEHNFDLDQTYALGVEWSKLQGVGRMLRFFLEYHNGFSKEGQFLRERSDYFAIKLTYGF